MRAVSQEWRKRTQEQQQAWIGAAQRVPSRLRLTQGPLTGQVLFVKLNSVLALLGRELLVSPPEQVGFGPNPVEDLVIRREHGRMRLKLRLVGPVVEDIMVYGEAGVSAGRNKPRHPVYLGLLPAARGGWSDITEQYVARFGLPEPGKKIIICTRQQRNGWEDYAVKVSGALVPVPKSLLNTPKALKGERPAFKRSSELLGLPDFHLLTELPELNGFPLRPSAFSLQPSAFPFRPSSFPPFSDGTTIFRGWNDGRGPMCTGKSSEIAPFSHPFPNHAARAPFPAHFPAPFASFASLAGCLAGCALARKRRKGHSIRPICPIRPSCALPGNRRKGHWVGSAGPADRGCALPGNRRKGHWRALWRGT